MTVTLALDTETTGLDLRHGAEPYYVSTCYGDGPGPSYHWRVDPLTRKVQVDQDERVELQAQIDEADEIIIQNSKFDVAALSTIGIEWTREHWAKVRDTLIAAHLIASNQPHDLTTLVLIHLGIDVKPFDDAVRVVTMAAHRWAKKYYPDWRIAKKGLPEMPSAKGTVWKYDMWLPGQILDIDDDAPSEWRTPLEEYADTDAVVLPPLYKAQMKIIRKRGLEKLYRKRLEILPIIFETEEAGVTLNSDRLDALVAEYGKESERLNQTCVSIATARGCELTLPKSGNNGSLIDFVFDSEDGLELPVVKKTKKGAASLDKAALEIYMAKLEEDTDQYKFVKSLKDKRSRDTALQYMESYRRYWIEYEGKDWYVLYPSLNPTGTDTLRWSSSNPNEQNISKKEGFNLRYCFGPAPGREWWSIDANNIELRIPAYAAGEKDMIALFEQPDVPPYYGSNHLLVFDVLHTKRLKLDTSDDKYLLKAKKKYASTWYQWTKNGNFAVQYGSVESSGTADRAYHIDGAFGQVKKRFKAIHGPGGLNERMIAHAEKYGYVETMPDLTVDPEHGYPLLCTRTNYNRILPTVPLNYFVQGTAMWWMMMAMINVQGYLDALNDPSDSYGYFMIMQVHDELVFDFPYKPNKGNLPKIRKIARLMSAVGDNIGVPTPCSIEYHPNTWSESE